MTEDYYISLDEEEPIEYHISLDPPLDYFVTNLDIQPIKFSDMFLFERLYSLLVYVLTADVLYSVKKEEERRKREEIKNTVRSYGKAFNKFNNGLTYFETDKDGFRRRGQVRMTKDHKLKRHFK